MFEISHSTELRGEVCPHSSKASRREDLEVEEPGACWYASAFHFDPTLPGMLGSTLIGHQVIQVGEAREKGLLTAVWVMEALHHEQFPVDGVMRLSQQGAGDGHLRVGEHRIPARLLGLKPASHARAIGHPSRGGDVINKVAQPLTERKYPQALALARSVEQGMALRA